MPIPVSPSLIRENSMNMTIRHYEVDDIPLIKAIYEQPSCYAGTLQLPYPAVYKWHHFLASRPQNYYSLVADVNDEIVGVIALETHANSRRRHVGSLGMVVSEAHQGKGIGSALIKAILDLANNWAAVSRIELEVFTDNECAIKLYKKYGFIIEGTARKYAFRNGEYEDAYLMAKT